MLGPPSLRAVTNARVPDETPITPWLTGRWSAGHPHQPERLVMTPDHTLGQLADALRVVLLLGLRLQWAPLTGDQHVVVGPGRHGHALGVAQHPRLVEGVPGRVVLLAVRLARLR